MLRNWWNKSRQWALLALFVIIAACGNEQSSSLVSGAYLPRDIEVLFEPKIEKQKEENHQSQSSDVLATIITKQLEKSYFAIEDPVVQIFIEEETLQGILTPENIILSQFATFQLTPQPDGSLLVFSNDHPLCQQIICDIRFTLVKTSQDDLTIFSLNNLKTESSISRSEQFTNPVSIDILTLFKTPFWGVEHEISDHIGLKLSPIQSNGLIYGMPEHMRISSLDLGKMKIDLQDPKIDTLFFYSHAVPSSDVHQITTTSYLFLIPKDQAPEVDLSLLNSGKELYYADAQNLLTKDATGFYALQYRYFPSIKYLVVALSESHSMEEIQEHLQAINTLSILEKNTANASIDQKSQRILLTDIHEPLTTLQDRYNITLTEMFRVAEIQENYRQAVTKLLTSSELFLKTGPTTQNGYHLFTQHLGDYRFNETYLKIHQHPLKKVITALQNLNNVEESSATKISEVREDLWHDPIYLYSINPQQASGLSYLKEIQPGITLEIFSPAFQGHVAEKVLFAKLLENISWQDIPEISPDKVDNIAQYSALSKDKSSIKTPLNDAQKAPDKDQLLKYYEFKEGKTNLDGTLLPSFPK